MNFDLDTKEGMNNAIAWTNSCLGLLAAGGAWLVPRSLTIVRRSLNEPKQISVHGVHPDPSILRVLRAAGYTITNHESTTQNE